MADTMPKEDEWTKPFTLVYVMKLTIRNMKRSVNISVTETSARLSEFDAGSDKWNEILSTLNALHALKKLLDDFELNNPIIFPRKGSK